MCTDCKHGECVGPNRCKCSAGYFGPACDISKLKSPIATAHQSSGIGATVEAIDCVFSSLCVQAAVKDFGAEIAHTNAIVNMTVSVINSMASVNVRKATLVTDVN